VGVWPQKERERQKKRKENPPITPEGDELVPVLLVFSDCDSAAAWNRRVKGFG
jgi:hypothetical protein